MLKKLSTLFSVLVLAGLLVQPASAHNRSSNVAVTNSALSLRTCASTSCHRIGVIPRNVRVKVRGCRNGWCKIRVNGRRGFVAKRFLNRGHRHNHRPTPRRYRRGNGLNLHFSFGL
ncbi:MAG: SH3 domain-containing protein [Alphaproteobacteria bacterium]